MPTVLHICRLRLLSYGMTLPIPHAGTKEALNVEFLISFASQELEPTWEEKQLNDKEKQAQHTPLFTPT